MASARVTLVATWVVYMFGQLSVRSSANAVEANPIGKAIELLDVLSKQIEKEGAEDVKGYKEYTAFYREQKKESLAIIKKSGIKISQLQTDLKELKATREADRRYMEDTANFVAGEETTLKNGRATRKREIATFEKNEATFVKSLEQLDLSIEVLKTKMPNTQFVQKAPNAQSVLSMAERLKKTLSEGTDFALSRTQRRTLNSFMQAAWAMTSKDTAMPQNSANEQASLEPLFLQLGSKLRGKLRGPYEAQNGGLLDTIVDLQQKVTKERDAGIQKNEDQKEGFAEWVSGVLEELGDAKKAVADTKTKIAESQETSSRMEATLLETQEIEKTESAHLQQLETEFRKKTQAYKMRLSKRRDEGVAVHEARRVMMSEEAKHLVKAQSIGTVQVNSEVSFVQVSQEHHEVRRKAVQVLKHATTPGLALLALQTAVHFERGADMDPFDKVKEMLRSMLEKLTAAQAEESKHAAWCDHEMAKSSKDKTRKDQDVRKLKDRLDALEADLAQTKADIETGSEDLKKTNAALASARRIRRKEHSVAVAAMKQYKDGAALLGTAVKVLKNFYNHHPAGSEESEFKQRRGAGKGVIALLEVAMADFQKLSKETQESEGAAAQDFKDMSSESGVRKAVFEKDLEYKKRTQVKLEFDQSTMKNDLKSSEKESAAIDSYLDKLKASCIVKGPSYEEKKAKREAELKSLKDAFEFLNGQ